MSDRAPSGPAEIRCNRCGALVQLIETILDPRRGLTLRMFKCICGEQTWTTNPQ
jgi:hypothetical protein